MGIENQLWSNDSRSVVTTADVTDVATELQKLEKDIGGIQDMNTLPDAIFVIDVGFYRIFVL